MISLKASNNKAFEGQKKMKKYIKINVEKLDK